MGLPCPKGQPRRVMPPLSTPIACRSPLPRTLFATSERHRTRHEGGWRILTPRHTPWPDLEGHLTFALKNEGLDLAILKRLFAVVTPEEMEAIVRAKPTGGYARRLWFLYEWLLDRRLDLPDASIGNYEPVVNPQQQWAIPGENSPRHRVRNNAPRHARLLPPGVSHQQRPKSSPPWIWSSARKKRLRRCRKASSCAPRPSCC